MRRYLPLFFLFSLSFVCMHAKHITSSEALRLVTNKTNKRAVKAKNVSSYQLAYTAEEYYVFNNTNGFLVLAAEDCLPSIVLGYSDNGRFELDAIPDAMRELLDELNREIAIVANGSHASSLTSEVSTQNSQLSSLAPIEPLVMCKWNQGTPYNNMCPISSSGSRCVAGCVPVALAQLMYYHKWPEHGTGQNTYSWNLDGTRTTLSADFSQNTYDWANMCDTYGKTNTEVQINAMAKLMSDCGISVDAEYEPDATNASSDNVVKALISYFDYDKTLSFVQRAYYSKIQWYELLYDNLAQGLPIYYRGTSNEGGHAFVCDGYKDGLFHINWGWGGMSDGYFELSILEPSEQGIGGSTSGYQQNQKAIIGIKPNNGEGGVSALMYCKGSFTYALSKIEKTGNAIFMGVFENETCVNRTLTVGVKLTDKEGRTQYLPSSDQKEKNMKIYEAVKKLTIPMSGAGLNEGTYIVTPAFLDVKTGAWHDMPVLKSASKPYIIATVGSDQTISFSYPTIQTIVTIDDISPKSRIVAGYDSNVDVTITCTEGEYLDNLYLAFLERGTTTVVSKSSKILADLAEGEQHTYNIEMTNPTSAGLYDLAMINEAGDVICNRYEVTVAEAPASDLAITGNLKAISKAINNLKFNLHLQCSGGVFNKKITLFFYDVTKSVGSIPQSGRTFIMEGDEPIDILFEGDVNLTAGGSYNAIAYYSDDNGNWQSITYLRFKATEATGIVQIENGRMDDSPFFNTLGQRVDADTKGVIISNGKKFIKK